MQSMILSNPVAERVAHASNMLSKDRYLQCNDSYKSIMHHIYLQLFV